MSLSRRAVSRFHSADVLICATLILSAAACSRTPSLQPRPAVAERAGERHKSTIETGLPRFPGVDLVPMGHGAFAIRIHSGLVGDGPPLYVIDGQPMMIDLNRGIDWLRPEDISRITVVKNPADLAIYGPRGVNGVIAITTKHGAVPR
jgi:TonB-dependent SusC/RagA subfamily outer membrane receptor